MRDVHTLTNKDLVRQYKPTAQCMQRHLGNMQWEWYVFTPNAVTPDVLGKGKSPQAAWKDAREFLGIVG